MNITKKLLLMSAGALFRCSTAIAQTPVVVTNKGGDAVPVKVVNDPAKRSYHVGVDISFPAQGEPPAVPAGRMFVIEHVSGTLRTFNAFGATTCKPYELVVGLRPDTTSTIEGYAIIPTYMGTGQGISGDVNFFSISQSVSWTAAAGTVLGTSFSLGPVCSAPTLQGRIVYSGYLIKSN